MTFQEAFDPKKNAFCFLRHVLALGVIFIHCFAFGGFGAEPLATEANPFYHLGTVCVMMFFLLSGFLITRSYLGLQSPGRFLWHRALRILPGYWVCLVITAFVFAPFMIYLEHQNPWVLFTVKKESPLTYVTSNWFLMQNQQTIAGTLHFAPTHTVLNGPLWSLAFEAECYLGIAILGVIGILRNGRAFVFALFIVLWLLHMMASCWGLLYDACFPFLWPGMILPLFTYFSAGAAAYLYREKIPCKGWIAAASAGVIVISYHEGLLPQTAPFALSYLFLWLAFKLPFQGLERFGDISYGLYIYAGPIQHILSLGHVNKSGYVVYFASTLLVTFCFATGSYSFVEAPALRLKNASPRLPGAAAVPDTHV